jgi:hypothetical protein
MYEFCSHIEPTTIPAVWLELSPPCCCGSCGAALVSPGGIDLTVDPEGEKVVGSTIDSVAVGDTNGGGVDVADSDDGDGASTVSVDVAVMVEVDGRPSVIVKSGRVSSDFPLPLAGGSGEGGGDGSSASSSFFRKKLGGSLYLPLPLRRRNSRSRIVCLFSIPP